MPPTVTPPPANNLFSMFSSIITHVSPVFPPHVGGSVLLEHQLQRVEIIELDPADAADEALQH